VHSVLSVVVVVDVAIAVLLWLLATVSPFKQKQQIKDVIEWGCLFEPTVNLTTCTAELQDGSKDTCTHCT
jgi:hypothetical protein